MNNYQVEMKNITEKVEIPSDNIFNYVETPHEKEFDDMFIFSKGALENFDYLYENYDKSFFYFRNDISLNAHVCSTNGYNTIAINSGILVNLIDKISNNENIEKCLLSKYDVTKKLDSGIAKIMYDMGTMFIFYHELGHIIQHEKNAKYSFLDELQNNNLAFDIDRHKLEMDADEFSALCIGTSLVQYIKKLEHQNGICFTKKEVEQLFEIIMTGVVLSIAPFYSYSNFYMEDKSHPHPIIRTFNILYTILSYCNDHRDIQNFEVLSSHISILSNVFDNVAEIEPTTMNNFTEILRNNGQNISLYIDKLRTQVLTDNNLTLAVNKWNEKSSH